MTYEQLPADGEKVLFASSSWNKNRQSLNMSICRIVSRKSLPSDSLTYEDYTDHIAVEIQLPYQFDDERHNGGITWADLTEIHLILT